MRQCGKCRVEKYQKLLEEKNPQINTCKENLVWKQWKNIPYTKNGVTKRKMGDEVNTGNLKRLVCDYSTHLDSMSLHQFNKIYQLRQFNLCMKNLKKGQVLFVHDFSQNLLLYTQNEPQGCHWDHNQITIHPTVV